jgi:hypothetical protein
MEAIMLAHARNAVVLLLVSGAVSAAPAPFLKKPGPPQPPLQRALARILCELARHGEAEIPELGWTVTAQGIAGNRLTRVVIKVRDERGKVALTCWIKEVEFTCSVPHNVLYFRTRGGKSASDDGSTAEWSSRTWEFDWPQ